MPECPSSTCLLKAGRACAAGVIGGLLSFVVINGLNAALDQLLEAIGYVPKLIHRTSSVCLIHPLAYGYPQSIPNLTHSMPECGQRQLRVRLRHRESSVCLVPTKPGKQN